MKVQKKRTQNSRIKKQTTKRRKSRYIIKGGEQHRPPPADFSDVEKHYRLNQNKIDELSKITHN